MTKQMLVNMWIAPDGTRLQCKSVYDFVSYTDADGNDYFVDFGGYYTRVFGELRDACLYEGDSHEEIRKYFSWKTYGKNGDQPGKWITLNEMSNLHIENILLTQKHIKGSAVERLFQAELEYRNQHGVQIND